MPRMRVVAGEARGRALQAPPGRGTRPTSDRVREAIFDVLGSMAAVEGAVVADLFAGSGALGIEALSRGAAHVSFVDREQRAVATIRANLAATGFARPRAEVVRADVLRWLDSAAPVDLVFCDPPYAYHRWPALLGPLASVTGLALLETGDRLDLGAGWQVLKEKHYGGTVVTVARPADKPAQAANRKGDT
jgi:16S rRNA (guanine966-N2)-methyltransferase